MSDAVRVLVVEDEALIACFVEDALSDGGFQACSVPSGEAALSTFRDGREGSGPADGHQPGWWHKWLGTGAADQGNLA